MNWGEYLSRNFGWWGLLAILGVLYGGMGLLALLWHGFFATPLGRALERRFAEPARQAMCVLAMLGLGYMVYEYGLPISFVPGHCHARAGGDC